MRNNERYTYTIVYAIKEKREGYIFWVYDNLPENSSEPKVIYEPEELYINATQARQAANEYMELLHQ